MTSNVSFGKYTIIRPAINNQRIVRGTSYAQRSQNANGTESSNGKQRTRDAKEKEGSQQARPLSYQQLTDGMHILNTFGSLTSGNKTANIPAAVPNASALDNSAGVAGGSSMGCDDMASMSGLAQNIERDVLDGVDTSELRYLENTLDEGQFKGGSISYYNPENFTEINTRLNAGKRKVNSALAREQANFNSIQTQKQTAEANVTRLESQVDGAAEAQNTAQTNLEQCSGELKQQTQARDQADDRLASMREEYKGVCDDVKTKESAKSSAQDKLSSAKTSVGQSETAVKSAEQSLQSAQSALDSTPQTLEDGSPNPAYEPARANFEKAKVDKQQADQSLKDAQAYEEECNTNLETVTAELEEAQEKKQNCLDNIKTTDEECKKLAEQCENLQNSVEQHQESYDTARETYDDASANHERLNSELEAQQGILTEYKAIESNLDALKETAGQIEGIEAKLDNAMNEYSNSLSPESKAKVENQLLENASATEGCGMHKTPKENLLSCTQEDLDRLSTRNGICETWTEENNCLDGFTSNDLAGMGYKQNSDGSFTDPRTGVTMINVYGKHWQNSIKSDGIYGDTVNNRYSGLSEVRNRAYSQKNIHLEGRDANGQHRFRWTR